MGPQVEKQSRKAKRVVIRTIDGIVAEIPIDKTMKEEAIYWCKQLDSRRLLKDNERLEMRKVAEETLKVYLKVDDTAVNAMAVAGVVQVTIPFDVNDLKVRRTELSPVDYALMLPWEYVLSAATKRFRGNYSLCVVRHVDGNNAATERFREAKRIGAKQTTGNEDHGGFSFLQTAPKEFRNLYDFSVERELVEGAFGEVTPAPLSLNPSIKELSRELKDSCPDVLHVTGIDSRLGAKLRKKIADESQQEPAKKKKIPSHEVVDGLFFDGDDKAKDTNFRTIAKAVTPVARKPQLIGFNCQYSGTRIAPYCVALGAREAIGIQNTLDDDLAERFFVRFYQYWNAPHTNEVGDSANQDSLAAFIAAWDFVKSMGVATKGTGIMLWFNTSVFGRRIKGRIEPSLKGIDSVKAQLKSDKKKHASEEFVANPNNDHIKDLVSVVVEPFDVLTPCMLHYGESVLQKLYFLFKNLTPNGTSRVECIKGIDVEVTLNIGQESYPYRTRISLGVDHPNLELTNGNLIATPENPSGGIQVPLTSGLIRSTDDNVRGNVFVHIEWEGQILLKHTYSVKVAPTNEWRLNEKDSLLQPMFVHPRDDAVKDVISAAQKYLCCIEGSGIASFRGYQADDIEPQINAIWTALTIDFELGYVSPPPSYNEGTQRLRTPSQVLREGRGTCIDLALLMASCLEWIELYPVIINTAKHTFVGCWRYADEDVPDWIEEEVSNEIVDIDKESGETTIKGEHHRAETKYWQQMIPCYQTFSEEHRTGAFSNSESTFDNYPWVFSTENYGAFYKLISSGAIIPMETVCITEKKFYDTGKEEATAYFGEKGICGTEEFSPGDFESVTDVLRSRQYLQPLPLPKK